MGTGIRFNKFHVTNGIIKARVSYHLDNRVDGRKCATLYANDWDRSLGKLFAEYKNETDSMTDYFDQGKVVLFEDHESYQQARSRAVSNQHPKTA